MPNITCSTCRKTKPGVKLCADDLLCPECAEENERQLRELRKNNAIVHDSSTSPADVVIKSRASKSKPSKKALSSDNVIVSPSHQGAAATTTASSLTVYVTVSHKRCRLVKTTCNRSTEL